MTADERKAHWAGQIIAAMMLRPEGIDTTSDTELRAAARGAWRLADALERARPPKEGR